MASQKASQAAAEALRQGVRAGDTVMLQTWCRTREVWDTFIEPVTKVTENGLLEKVPGEFEEPYRKKRLEYDDVFDPTPEQIEKENLGRWLRPILVVSNRRTDLRFMFLDGFSDNKVISRNWKRLEGRIFPQDLTDLGNAVEGLRSLLDVGTILYGQGEVKPTIRARATTQEADEARAKAKLENEALQREAQKLADTAIYQYKRALREAGWADEMVARIETWAIAGSYWRDTED